MMHSSITMGDIPYYKPLPSKDRNSDIDRDNAVAGKNKFPWLLISGVFSHSSFAWEEHPSLSLSLSLSLHSSFAWDEHPSLCFFMCTDLSPYSRRKRIEMSSLFPCIADYLAYESPTATNPPQWQLSLPHVAIATLASVLFGYHMG